MTRLEIYNIVYLLACTYGSFFYTEYLWSGRKDEEARNSGTKYFALGVICLIFIPIFC